MGPRVLPLARWRWRWVVKLGTMQGVAEEEKQTEEEQVVVGPLTHWWCGGVVNRPTR